MLSYITWDRRTNLSRLVEDKSLDCIMFYKDIHEHGVDLYIRSISMDQQKSEDRYSSAHIFQVFFANIDQGCALLDLLDR